jgi:hypothetical protein
MAPPTAVDPWLTLFEKTLLLMFVVPPLNKPAVSVNPASLEPMDTTKTGPLLQAAAEYVWPFPSPPGVTLPSTPTQAGPGYPLLRSVLESLQLPGRI